MTNSQAKSELMQIYMSLSEEKKQALDVLMAQADGEYINKTESLKALDTWDKFGYYNHDMFWLDKDSEKDYVAYIRYDDAVKCINGMPSVDIPPAEPREVLYSGDGYADGEMVYDMAECMNCGREFEYDDETWGCNFCPDCGQALKWEGEQE